MLRIKMPRTLQLAALAAMLSMAFGSLTWGQDDDDYHYRHNEASEHGYKNGYRDGYEQGYRRGYGY